MGEHGVASRYAHGLLPPALTINADGSSPFVLVCDHASNRIPDIYDGLGLDPIERLRHIAWDPGALAVSMRMVDLLDAPLVQSTVSRLVIDCNRWHTAPDLMPQIGELTVVPGNKDVSDGEKLKRIAAFHDPFHAQIDTLLAARAAAGRETILVAMHSFTPVYKGMSRPWPIGLIHGVDTGYTRAVFEALQAADPTMHVGWNEPYAALNGVTYTLEHHGDERGLKSTMVEIRHDEILEPAGVAHWASRLAQCLEIARNGNSDAGTRLTYGGNAQ
jgi:predicted N-formylglutamate amidohydrolase